MSPFLGANAAHQPPQRARSDQRRPGLATVTPEQIGELIQLARLLRGEDHRTTWSDITMTRGVSGDPPPTDPEFGVLLTVSLW
ncbi:hypothetical protein ACQEVF_44720 [Nonomuraea polychroma]|uniref:hypothetical protein n=1 Tax=Nonomuraea polychroma TaxID=46176 RepID=UPI003D8C245C